jgi:hypothetical protein
MRTKEEILRHVADLEVLRDAPCSCHRTGHAEACRNGRILMVAVIQNLRWAAGDSDPEHLEFVERLAADAARIRQGN